MTIIFGSRKNLCHPQYHLANMYTHNATCTYTYATTPSVHTRSQHTQHHASHTHSTRNTTQPTTDHDLARVSIKSASSVTSIISCGCIVFGISLIRNIRNLMRIYCSGINLIFVTALISARMVADFGGIQRHQTYIIHKIWMEKNAHPEIEKRQRRDNHIKKRHCKCLR